MSGLSPQKKKEIDDKFKALNDSKLEWRDLSYTDKLGFLKEIMANIGLCMNDWVEAGAEWKHADNTGDEWAGGVYPTTKVLRGIISQYEYASKLELKGEEVRFKPAKAREIDGQWKVPVFPLDISSQILFPEVTAETYIIKGEEPTIGQDVIRAKELEPEVSLVLGAGNQSSIVICDTLHKMFLEHQVVFLKHNPVCDYMIPFVDIIFAPLIQQNYFHHVPGAIAEGSYLVEICDNIHITGSDKTHDIIVWGGLDKTVDQPKTTKITSELGCITPLIICPVHYNETELDTLVQHITGAFINNNSYNCNAAKLVITSSEWEQVEEFWERVSAILVNIPPRYTYYPGSADRYEGYVSRYEHDVFGDHDDTHLPWTIHRKMNLVEDEHYLFNEPFCPVLSEFQLDEGKTPLFLRRAVDFCNDRLWGNLSCSIFISDSGAKAFSIEIERAISNLKYGGVALNAWSAIIYALGSTGWGGYYTNTLENCQSGLGFVHNTSFVDNIEKSVVRAPLVLLMGAPLPYFPRHKNIIKALEALCKYEISPSLFNVALSSINSIKG